MNQALKSMFFVNVVQHFWIPLPPPYHCLMNNNVFIYMYNIALKQCILGWTGDHEYNQNLLIYSNNKLILRPKQFNFAVATNRRLVMLAFNLLLQLPTMYYVLYCFKTDGILYILHNHLYHAIHQLSNVNQPF